MLIELYNHDGLELLTGKKKHQTNKKVTES